MIQRNSSKAIKVQFQRHLFQGQFRSNPTGAPASLLCHTSASQHIHYSMNWEREGAQNLIIYSVCLVLQVCALSPLHRLYLNTTA